MIKPADYQREPCDCGECRQAGVDDKPQLRDPRSGAFAHGYALKGMYDAKESFWALVKQKKSERSYR